MRSGLSAPNVMDGMPGLTQPPISTGETFVYEFTLQDAGSVGISPSRCVVSWWFECSAFMPTVDGYANLAEFYRSRGDDAQSERAYADAIAALPDSAELRYGHGLSLVRTQERARALQEFREASRLEPANSRFRTTLAIALDDAGRTAEAFDMLFAAAISGSSDVSLLGTAIQFGLKLQRFDETLRPVETLSRLQPDNPQIKDLLRQLRAITGAGK
ncbi:multicopper oxidase domain-containing protein [Rhizobium sp. BK060]|uniref:multicopper oxidase domain-containing protein n=1 Tax=Rhizobium sp. BK060 TaxID=2587096 RepID=UPI00161E5571|nr:multicopper oxidase domain-containing protein [Rhizobium sp. BK060]MBB3397281.1 tetratricopeptide (TPR) repeat protein [Rhizobium sp. BK060]